MTWKVTYKAKANGKWRIMYRVLQADSKEQAIIKMDLWRPLILSIDLV
jgi:hypothetical protein